MVKELREANVSEATGAVGNATSPLRPHAYHSIFELSFRASPGGYGVQLHDPVLSLYVHPVGSHACVAVFHHRHSLGPEHPVVRCAARLDDSCVRWSSSFTERRAGAAMDASLAHIHDTDELRTSGLPSSHRY